MREFVVSGDGCGSKVCSTLASLENLNHLGGYLSISGLGNVVDFVEAKKAELKRKKNLSHLKQFFNSNKEIEADEARISNFAKLSSLEYLSLNNMSSLKRVGDEILGIESHVASSPSSSLIIAFPKLKSLKFESLDEREEWDTTRREDEDVTIMPCLHSLTIDFCIELKNRYHQQKLSDYEMISRIPKFRRGLLALDFSHRRHEDFVVDSSKEEMVIEYFNCQLTGSKIQLNVMVQPVIEVIRHIHHRAAIDEIDRGVLRASHACLDNSYTRMVFRNPIIGEKCI
ncbi:hypothetical protein Dsin_007744 [Dipteronia sinensis]|uniref:R13L1/DRL21-like LRR repeat region domain-containing protein n=1 Tax=Dipteronia sinensis TaxID=43782 RepID=A0AAE0B164_9ROSI|nr:hypothetical protein Dsin_007744 [Dipteronia sinensis]